MADRSAAFSVQFDPETSLGAQQTVLTHILLCRRDLRPFAGRLVLLAACICAAAGALSLVPLYLGQLIELFVDSMIDAIIREHFEPDVSALLHCVLPVAALLAAHAVFSYLTGHLAASVASGYADRMRQKVFAKILRVRMDYLDKHSKQALHETATQHIDVLSQSVNLLLSKALYACVLLAAFTAASTRLGNPAPLLLILVILAYSLVQLLGTVLRSRRVSADTGAQTPLPDARQMYRNLTVLHASGDLDGFSHAMLSAQSDRLRAVRRGRFADSAGRICALLLTGLAVCALLLRSAYTGETPGVGTLLSLVLYIRRMETPLADVAFFASSLRSLAGSAHAVYSFLDAPDEAGGQTPVTPDADGGYRIGFRDVRFAYTPQSRDVLRGLSFTVRDRGITVIRGETGIGKTTILKLLTGFYRPQGGSITLNGIDTAQLDPDAFRDLFAVIVQEGTLFERTIAENIAYPHAQADPQTILQTLNRIGQPDLADTLPDGLQTVFSPAAHTLSDGQIQLVLIARALLHRKRFLILDESLSHLDAQSAQHVLHALRIAAADTGVILISHRSAHLPPADQTLSLDDPHPECDACEN